MISNNHANPVSGQLYGEPTIESSRSTTNPSNTVPSTGSTQDSRSVSALPDARSDLLQLPPEIKLVVFDQLSYRDIIALRQTCKMLYSVIDEKMLVYNACFKQHLTPAHQENFRVAANLLTQPEIETYIRQFSNDQQFITHCLSLLGSQFFPEFLFFHMMRLKAECQHLEVKAIKNIVYYNYSSFVKGAFSPNGRHILTRGVFSGTIHSLNDKGQWEMKTSIPREGRKLSFHIDASFSPNSRHVVTCCHLTSMGDDLSLYPEIEIYNCSNAGEWVLAITIPYDYGIDGLPVIFFNKSQNIALIHSDDDKRLTIYGLDNNKNWSPYPISTQASHVYQISHSPDGLHGVTFQYRPNFHDIDSMTLSFIEFSIISGHNWISQYSFNCDYVYKMIFSPDSRHLTVAHCEEIKIYSINSNEQWKLQKIISYKDNDDNDHDDHFYYYCPESHHTTFSPNGHYLATTITYSHRVKIYGLNSAGQWHQITTINHSYGINMVSFSPDSRHVVTASRDCFARVYGLETNGRCSLEEEIIHDSAVRYASFSPDSRQLVTSCAGGQIKICGMLANRKWREKGSVPGSGDKSDDPYEMNIHSVKFSPCGFLLLESHVHYRVATLYTLRKMRLNAPHS